MIYLRLHAHKNKKIYRSDVWGSECRAAMIGREFLLQGSNQFTPLLCFQSFLRHLETNRCSL